MHHADLFAIIRSGRIDVTVLGAYEVAQNGDFANWKMAGQQGGGIGGAMDLAACARHVFVAMEHQTRNGSPRLVERCAIPVTARGVVNLVVTNFGLFEITPSGMALKEIAPGVTVDEIKAATGCNLIIPAEVPPGAPAAVDFFRPLLRGGAPLEGVEPAPQPHCMIGKMRGHRFADRSAAHMDCQVPFLGDLEQRFRIFVAEPSDLP